ncbi:hypothetical protein [Vulcanococcus limneticus]|uniref:hypothetical protein n=1 Tax=Vulcanococcus limneticus TaxID=2170428 RepID=UPI00398C0066
MRNTHRTEVFWRDGRLYPVTNLRPKGRGPWPSAPRFKSSELVARIQGDTGNIQIEEGPAATSSRINDALLFHKGVDPESLSKEIWQDIPDSLKQRISRKVISAESKLADQWRQYSNEEALTGAFFSQLNGRSVEQGWTVNISFVEFSKQVKEKKTGTDIAVVIDALSADGRRSFKTLWLQAKSSEQIPTASSRYPRMDTQLKIAKNYCEASMGIVYTPYGVYAVGATKSTPAEFSSVLDSSMQCQIGDTRIEALKNSLNRKRLFLITLTEESG